MEKINLSRVIVSGAIFAIIGQLVHIIGSGLTMGFYTDPTYFPVWSKVMMPTEGPPPISFFYHSILFGLIAGILLAFVYAIIKTGVPGIGAKKGFIFGLLAFLIAVVPGSLSTYLLINLPTSLIIYWALENLVIYLISCTIFGKLII